MPTSSIRILVVDDFEPFRSFAVATLQTKAGLQVIGEASDGLEAVQKAHELQPDLILLDIGLPTLSGIEAARRIRQLSPDSKIICLSQETSADIVKEAFRIGVSGYVVKANARSQLVPAVESVLRGERFVDDRFAGHGLKDGTRSHPSNRTDSRHGMGFYSDDLFLLDDLARFVAAALKAGNSAIVLATESHRDDVIPKLQAHGVDVDDAIREGRYIALDVADFLSAVVVDDVVDSLQVLQLVGDLIMKAAKAATRENARVAIFGECAPHLLAMGNIDAAIQVEKLGNQLADIYDIEILCGYSEGTMDSKVRGQICAEHSLVHSR